MAVGRHPARAGVATVAALALAVLVGCGAGQPTGTPPPTVPPASSPTTSTVAPADPSPPATGTPPPAAPTGTPARLAIPAIGVDAAVVGLGKEADGSLQVPEFGLAGWWQRGPRPGERGPAVIAAHVDSRSGPDVFARLHQLVPGDLIEVTLTDGQVIRYRAQRTERFPKDAFPTWDVYQLTAGTELRLITCDGAFDAATGHYLDNLIAFAVPAA